MSSAVQREVELAQKAAKDNAEAAEKAVEESAKLTAAARKEFAETGGAQLHEEISEAERIMRLPTPEAIKATGQNVGDPTKGPAS